VTGNSKCKIQNADRTCVHAVPRGSCFRFAFCILNCVILIACSGSMDFERMRQQQRGDPYGQSVVFSNGMVMRVPPEGTMPMDQPIAASRPVDLIARGEHQFQIFCAVCHGVDGSGNSVMTANMPGGPPLSLLIGPATEYSDSELFDLLSHGRNRMPAFDWAMPAADRQAVVAFVRMLRQKSGAVPQATAR